MAEGAYTRESAGRGGGGLFVGKGVHYFDGVREIGDLVVVGPVFSGARFDHPEPDCKVRSIRCRRYIVPLDLVPFTGR